MWALEMNEPKKELDLFSACNVPIEISQEFSFISIPSSDMAQWSC